MKVLVIGSNGQLGRCLIDQLEHHEFSFISASRDQIDISNFQSTKSKIKLISPDIIINASAYTAVDTAENDRETAEVINYLAVSNLAEICVELDCWLIHISTDYVFDGNSKTPYLEGDKTNPQGVYGDTKLKGEMAIQSSSCKHIIVRTAWVFSEYGSNFLKTMLKLGSVNNEINVVGDQIGCPTYAQDIAKAIIHILPILHSSQENSGLYHYCGNEACSWYDFSNEIFTEAKAMGFKSPDFINQIATSAYPTPADRPAYSVLDCTLIHNTFGVDRSDWRAGIRMSLHNLKIQVD